MDVLTLGNLLPYLLQSGCVALLATAVCALVRVDSAAVRYAYWRAVLGGSLALPLLQPFHRSAVNADTSAASTVATSAVTFGAAGPLDASSLPLDWTPFIVAGLTLGVLVRLVWVAAGLYSLQRLRGLGVAATDDNISALQLTLGTRAHVRVVPGLKQPATFGAWRPVVLLPESLGEHSLEIQRALIAHELIHVQRRDWLWVISEELFLAAFWFNPAAWWIVAQVRRAREEAVDELAILVTGSRRHYVKALLAFAGETTLAPAPAFAHRRHLFRRIVLISTEAAMSSTRVVLSSALMTIVLVSGGWYTASAFPLSIDEPQSPTLQTGGPGPVERRAKPVTPENPVPPRTDYQAAEYPMEARTAGVTGAITLRVTLDEVGRVVETRRTAFSATVTNPRYTGSFSNTTAHDIDEFVRYRWGAEGDAVLRALEALTTAASYAMSQWRYEPPKDGPIAFDVAINFKADGETTTAQNAGLREGRLLGGSMTMEGALRVGGNVKAPTKIRDVRPVYPPEAQQAKVKGMVIVEARIGPDGSVEAAQVLRSIPLLDQAAIDAVRQWKFTPTLLNGVPVPVIMTVTVNFTLEQSPYFAR